MMEANSGLCLRLASQYSLKSALSALRRSSIEAGAAAAGACAWIVQGANAAPDTRRTAKIRGREKRAIRDAMQSSLQPAALRRCRGRADFRQSDRAQICSGQQKGQVLTNRDWPCDKR